MVKQIAYQNIDLYLYCHLLVKIMERFIFKYVHNFLLKNILITKFQSRLRPGDYCKSTY
jgi:hypothetical protein